MLNIFKFLKENNLFKTCVILDDFKDRDYYNMIKIFFKVSLIGRLGICYIKKEIEQTQDVNKLIEYYSYDDR